MLASRVELGRLLRSAKLAGCNRLTEPGANKSAGWGLGRLLCEAAAKATGGWLERPESREVECGPGSSASARRLMLSPVRYVPGGQQERPLSSHCCSGRRWRRKGAPSVQMLPEGNRDFGLGGKQKNALRFGEIEKHCCNRKSTRYDAIF